MPFLNRLVCSNASDARDRPALRRSARIVGVLVCAATLAACVTTPLPRLEPSTPAQWRNAPGGDPNAPAPDLREWWKAFHDPALDRLVDAALAENLTIRQASLRLRGARAVAERAGAPFLPSLGLHTYAEPTPDSSASYFQAGFDAKWEFGFFGRGAGQRRIAAGELGDTIADEQSARVSVVAEAVRAAIALRAAAERVDLLGELGKTSRTKVEVAATRVRLHLAAPAELTAAEAAAANAEAAAIEPGLASERARQQLAVLLGGGAAADSIIAEWIGAGDGSVRAPPLVLGDVRVDSAPADLVRTRPEIRRAENDVLKAAGELGVARADLYPRLGLGGSLTYAARVIGHSRLADADGIVTFGPAIEIPLFDWGQHRAIAAARDADLAASVLAYRQAVLEGVAEVETAMATLDAQRRRAIAAARAVTSVEQAQKTATRLRELGLADDADRAGANAAVVQARIDQADAEEQRSIAFVALYKALGGASIPAGGVAENDAAADSRVADASVEPDLSRADDGALADRARKGLIHGAASGPVAETSESDPVRDGRDPTLHGNDRRD